MIALDNVSKSFGEVSVFERFSYSFARGSRTCIMGASGRGKTTLLNLLLGIFSPDSGTVSRIAPASAVFQEDRLFEKFTVKKNLLATNSSLSHEQIVSLLTELGIEDCLEKSVSELSGGMRRRVAIARALLKDSELLVLDEPFKGLDEKLHETTANTVLNHLRGRTLVVATHDERDSELLRADVLNME